MSENLLSTPGSAKNQLVVVEVLERFIFQPIRQTRMILPVAKKQQTPLLTAPLHRNESRASKLWLFG